MTSNEIALPQPITGPERLGQGTAVEMGRAVAEVHAAMYAARQFPRDEIAATAAMEESCQKRYVAERAFFMLPRGNQTVTGPTVHLARELARCWGHIQHGVIELRRDDAAGQSEMQAFAWDVQTGTRLTHTFIVPHMRDKRDNKLKKTVPEPLISLQEVYENNSNNGARRLRECIFGVLPPWFTERAKELCDETLKKGNGKPLAEQVDNAVAWFEQIGVTVDRLERKLNMPRIRWSPKETAFLHTVFRSLERRETTVEQEFPTERVTAAEIQQPVAAPPKEARRPRADARDAATPKPPEATVDELWQQAYDAQPGKDRDGVDLDFSETMQVSPKDATPEQLAQFLEVCAERAAKNKNGGAR